MKKRLLMFGILLACILTGCAASRDPAVTAATTEAAMISREQAAAEITEPEISLSGERHFLLDLDADGQVEKLVYQDGALRRIFTLESQGERILMEASSLFLCDDKQTVLQFSEGAGGHTWFYYHMEEGELVPFECLVYHWGDNRYFRSEDCSAREDSLVELTEEEYRQAMAEYPCAEAENSFLGDLF